MVSAFAPNGRCARSELMGGYFSVFSDQRVNCWADRLSGRDVQRHSLHAVLLSTENFCTLHRLVKSAKTSSWNMIDIRCFLGTTSNTFYLSIFMFSTHCLHITCTYFLSFISLCFFCHLRTSNSSRVNTFSVLTLFIVLSLRFSLFFFPSPLCDQFPLYVLVWM